MHSLRIDRRLKHPMQIWVDADACPVAIKEILFRAADRMRVALTLVANKPLRTPPSPYINTIQVAAGFDVADDKIAGELCAGDLVITADIPLAAAVICKDGHVAVHELPLLAVQPLCPHNAH